MLQSLTFRPRTSHRAVISFGFGFGFSFGLLGICVTAGASEQISARKPAFAASQVETGAEPISNKRLHGDKPRAKPGGAAAAAATATAIAEPAPQDAMSKLRERLAKRLGAIKAQDASNPNVMRVVSRSGGEIAVDREIRGMQIQRRPTRSSMTAHPTAKLVVDQHNPSMPGIAPSQAHWDYVGVAGPESWGRLKPEFAKCASGARQSPIDIRDGIQVNLDPVQFDYKPSNFKVIDTGHTVQVNVGVGNSIEVTGRRYDLIQFHFHRPSEERINGKQFDMVVHLVHKDMEGRLAVVAVLLDRGSALPIVQSVWNNLPLEKNEEVPARDLLDLREMLPVERSYFTYMGSLTTPPCSEGVLWMVMKTALPVSVEQIGVFAHLYPMNARPIQSASGRLIKQSN